MLRQIAWTLCEVLRGEEMAYARYGHDSDVYVYEDTRGGYTCERCPGTGSQFRCETAKEMAEHLAGHVAKGDKVPAEALMELARGSRR